ncbi:hypothetical protein Tco_1072678 [Tanacetum coccineum]
MEITVVTLVEEQMSLWKGHGDEGGGESWRSLRCLFSLYMAVFGQPTSVPLAVCPRPDITHAVGVVSRFMSNQGREHWEAVKWLLRYLKCLRRLPFVSAENGLSWKDSPIQTMEVA